MKTKMKHLCILGFCILIVTNPVWAAEKKPNILVIWGDDIGLTNLSVNTRGMMGYRTPNIDRVAGDGDG